MGTINCCVNYSVYWVALLSHILLKVKNFMSVTDSHLSFLH